MPIKKHILRYILSEDQTGFQPLFEGQASRQSLFEDQTGIFPKGTGYKPTVDQAIASHFGRISTEEREDAMDFSIREWIQEVSESIYENGIGDDGLDYDEGLNDVEETISRAFMSEFDDPDLYEEDKDDYRNKRVDFSVMTEIILTEEGEREFREFAISAIEGMLWGHPLTAMLEDQMGKGGMTLYRAMAFSPDEVQKELSFYDGIGIYFTFDRDSAEPYGWGWNVDPVEVVVECFVPLSSIDWDMTANVSLWAFSDEMEVRLHEGAVVYLERIEVKIPGKYARRGGGDSKYWVEKERDFSPPIRLKA